MTGTNTVQIPITLGSATTVMIATGSSSLDFDVTATIETNGYALTLENDSSGPASHFRGAIRGSGSLVKTGDGAVTLDGVNDYAAGTVVLGGQLTVTRADALRAGTSMTISNDASVVLDSNMDMAIELGSLSIDMSDSAQSLVASARGIASAQSSTGQPSAPTVPVATAIAPTAPAAQMLAVATVTTVQGQPESTEATDSAPLRAASTTAAIQPVTRRISSCELVTQIKAEEDVSSTFAIGSPTSPELHGPEASPSRFASAPPTPVKSGAIYPISTQPSRLPPMGAQTGLTAAHEKLPITIKNPALCTSSKTRAHDIALQSTTAEPSADDLARLWQLADSQTGRRRATKRIPSRMPWPRC